MSLFVKFEGLSEVPGSLRRLPEHLEKSTILKMSQVAYDEAQKGAGRHVKTGALFRSLGSNFVCFTVSVSDFCLLVQSKNRVGVVASSDALQNLVFDGIR